MKALAIASVLFLASVANAQTPDGKALYQEKCVMCHDKTGMGTGILSRRVKVAELLLRDDLNAEFVATAARAGIGNMPAIPRGEVSDAQLKAIASYLAQSPEAKK
jgi:mono/diheme cytochrome c family protein